jgi:hypothetical protein
VGVSGLLDARVSLHLLKRRLGGGGCRLPKEKPMEERVMFQASVAFNMVAATATAGFLCYYFGKNLFDKESHVSPTRGKGARLGCEDLTLGVVVLLHSASSSGCWGARGF